LAQLTGLSASQSGSELTDLLPPVYAEGAGSTMLSAGVMAPDLIDTSTGTSLISMQPDTWSSVGHLPG
jgi:hypothetical protein